MIKCNVVSILDKYPKIALAVSGGSDSMALLHWFITNRNKTTFCVIHVNHHLRGDESDADSDFVKKYCDKFDIEFHNYDVYALDFARENNYTIEQAARILRRNIYYTAIQEYAFAVATAHHEEDQIETVFMHILRGSGLDGLCGMNIEDGCLLRPLLNVSKQEIISYLAGNNIQFREDRTNADCDYNRNYIRNIVFPVIKEKYPQVNKSFYKLSERAKELADFIDLHTPTIYADRDAVILELKNKHNVVAAEMIRRAFKLLGVESDIEERHIRLIIDMSEEGLNGRYLDMPYNTRAYCENGSIAISRVKDYGKVFIPFGVGEHEFCDYIIRVELTDKRSDDNALYLAADKVSENAVIRQRKKGDKIVKFGGGSKSLGDYLTDKKVPVRLRDNIPVIADGQEILAVVSVDISEKAAVYKGCEKIYKITFDTY